MADIAIDGGFFSDKSLVAEDFAKAFDGLISNGVLATNDANALKVTASSGMNVNVAAGYFWADGQFGRNASAKTVTIETASSDYVRYDRVIVRINQTLKRAEIAVLKGTATASPVVPDLTRDGTYYELSLATITVSASATSITTENIQDDREDTSVCGYCTPKMDTIDTATVFSNIYAQWDHIKGQLAEDPAGHLQLQIGDLTDLTTTEKTNLVGAVNEVKSIVLSKSSQVLFDGIFDTSNNWTLSLDSPWTEFDFLYFQSNFYTGGGPYKNYVAEFIPTSAIATDATYCGMYNSNLSIYGLKFPSALQIAAGVANRYTHALIVGVSFKEGGNS